MPKKKTVTEPTPDPAAEAVGTAETTENGVVTSEPMPEASPSPVPPVETLPTAMDAREAVMTDTQDNNATQESESAETEPPPSNAGVPIGEPAIAEGPVEDLWSIGDNPGPLTAVFPSAHDGENFFDEEAPAREESESPDEDPGLYLDEMLARAPGRTGTTEEVPAEEKDGADLEIATPEPVPRRRTVRKLRQASLDEEQSPKSPAAPVTTKEPVTPGGRVPSGERAERRSFYDLDFNALDRGLTPEQRQEWNSIYASYRGHSVLTGSIVGADPRVNRFRDRRTGRRVPLDDMYCATVILFRIPILIPAKEMWIKGEEREDFVLRSMGGASIDFVVTQVDREGCFAVASRRMAMQSRRYYFSTQPSLHSIGSRVKCRVLTVGPRRCLVECHGFDISLTQRDMSYTAIPDLRKQYHRGQELDCIVKDYDRREGRLVISVKETNPNPFDGAELRHPVRSRRQAVIAGKYAGGIFCNLPDGVVVMCSYSFQYDDAAFAIGDRVVVMIQRYDFHKKQIYGKIVAKW